MIPMLECLLYREKGKKSAVFFFSCPDKRTWSPVFRHRYLIGNLIDTRLALLVVMACSFPPMFFFSFINFLSRWFVLEIPRIIAMNGDQTLCQVVHLIIFPIPSSLIEMLWTECCLTNSDELAEIIIGSDFTSNLAFLCYND